MHGETDLLVHCRFVQVVQAAKKSLSKGLLFPLKSYDYWSFRVLLLWGINFQCAVFWVFFFPKKYSLFLLFVCVFFFSKHHLFFLKGPGILLCQLSSVLKLRTVNIWNDMLTVLHKKFLWTCFACSFYVLWYSICLQKEEKKRSKFCVLFVCFHFNHSQIYAWEDPMAGTKILPFFLMVKSSLVIQKLLKILLRSIALQLLYSLWMASWRLI